MKFVILTILILFAAEGLLQASAVKTPINAILRNAPKIVKGLKKASNAILTKDQSSKLKNVLRIRDGLDQETWYKIEQSVTFFKKVKELLRNHNITPSENPEGWKDEEILICEPSTKGKLCTSPCERQNSNYQWCWTNRAQTSFDYCSCSIRTPIRNWIGLMKKKMEPMLKQPINPKLVKDDTVQWIAIGVLSSIVTILIIGILARIVYNYRRENCVNVQNDENHDVQINI